MKKLSLVGFVLGLTVSAYAQSGNSQVKAFFGDKELNRVVIANISEMEEANPEYEAYTGNQITYGVDNVPNRPRAIVSNRGSNTADIINTKSNKIIKRIDLDHFPRSADAMNKEGSLIEISGMDKAMATILNLNTNKIISVVGENIEKDPDNKPDKGGTHATGHPYWLNDTMFVINDRYNKKIITYEIKGTESYKLSEVETLSSIHQLIPQKGYLGKENVFYAVEEGSNEHNPSIVRLELKETGLELVDRVFLEKEGVNLLVMKGHHGDFHPKEKLIYVGSDEGTLFIVDYENMKIVKTEIAGRGAGHTFMNSEKDLAIVINHSDVFISIFDLKTNTKIKDIVVSDEINLVGLTTLQAHPEYYMEGNNFYMALTEEGKIIEVDIEKGLVTNSIEFGGKLTMGAFVKH